MTKSQKQKGFNIAANLLPVSKSVWLKGGEGAPCGKGSQGAGDPGILKKKLRMRERARSKLYTGKKKGGKTNKISSKGGVIHGAAPFGEGKEMGRGGV